MQRKLAICFIFITVMLDAMGIGIIMPVTPDLIRELQAGTLAQAAIWGGILASSFAVMQFLFGALIGNLSDRYGRRPVLLLSLLVVAIDYIFMAITSSIWILLLARIISGIASATHGTANAYMADISKHNEKAQNFGLLGAAFGVGFIFGPMLGGILSEFGSRTPFFAAAILAILNFILGYFVLHETVTDKTRRPLELRRMNPFIALKNISHFPGIKTLLIIVFINQISFVVYPSVWPFYTRERYGWDAFDIGISLAVFGIAIAIVQGYIIRFIIPIIGEWRAVLFGLIMSCFELFFMGLATQGWMIYCIIIFTSIGFIMTPALSAIVSQKVPNNTQGELQGVLTGINAIASIISPILMTKTFSYFTTENAPVYLPAFPFYLATILSCISLILFFYTMRSNRD